MSSSKMSFAGPTIRLSSGSQTPPAIGTPGATTAAAITMPGCWMPIHAVSSQGQCTPTSDEDPWAKCQHRGDSSLFMNSVTPESVHSVKDDMILEESVLEAKEYQELVHDLTEAQRDLDKRIAKLLADRERDRERRSELHCRMQVQLHRWEEIMRKLSRGLQWLHSDDYLRVPLAATGKKRLACNKTKTTTPYASQNIMSNREANIDWPRSQQCTLTYSLRATVLVFRACHSAWKLTKQM